jgi:hypothetical protein
LGFFATFFGMNNADITGDAWMTLDQQIMYMCKSRKPVSSFPLTLAVILSAVVITVSISIAFSPWVRTVLNLCIRVPLAYVAEYTGIRRLWKSSPLEGGKVKRRSHISMARISKRRQEREESRRRGGQGMQRVFDAVDGEGLQNRLRRRAERVDTMV